MIKKFIEAWDKHHGELREYLRTHKQEEYCSYEELVTLLFQIVINPAYENEYPRGFNVKKLHRIDDGDYQGTLIFLIPAECYQPDASQYVFTSVYYGSCSGCDTLLAISYYEDDLPNEIQLNDYMRLCLHLLQNCRFLYCNDEDDCDYEGEE